MAIRPEKCCFVPKEAVIAYRCDHNVLYVFDYESERWIVPPISPGGIVQNPNPPTGKPKRGETQRYLVEFWDDPDPVARQRLGELMDALIVNGVVKQWWSGGTAYIEGVEHP